MPKYKDEAAAVRVYTVCDESKYLIVRNVLELGCSDELLNVFYLIMAKLKNVSQWMVKNVSHLLMFTGLSFIRSTMPGLPKGSWMRFSLEIDCKYHMRITMRTSLTQERS